jgi:hypothetical protein
MAMDGKRPPILTKITICQHILPKLQNIKFQENPSSGVSRFMQTDGWKDDRQTDRQDEANSRFT